MRGLETASTLSSDICERLYQIGWWIFPNHNVRLRMLLVVGAGGGTSQANRDVNGSATLSELAG
jgi:hypothetical protein